MSHVFLVHGSILHLSCDFIGISSIHWIHNKSYSWTHYSHLKWLDDPFTQEAIRKYKKRDNPPNFCCTRLAALEGKVPEYVPRIYLMHGRRGRRRDLSWFLSTVEEYLVKVNRVIEKEHVVPKNRRERILVALPIIGIRFLGGGSISGGIIKGIMDKVYQFSNDLVDYALVTFDDFAYKAALSYRHSIPINVSFPDIEPDSLIESKLKELATHAKNNNLAIFLGAGCSIPAGLPTWGRLLAKLSDKARMSEIEKKYLSKLSFLDQARIIEQRLGGNEILTNLIAEDMDIDLCSMQHCFLQSLTCNQIITTNYDVLYEKACENVRRKLLVLPYSPKETGDYLLKLHGCIRHPEDIVLTREDYIQYNDKKQALSGIVQSSMLTKHVMFIGFSLEDDNFHSIASTVKKATNDGGILGTSFQIIESPLLEELWGDRLNFINMKPAVLEPTGNDWSEGGRLLEIALDYMLQQTYDDHHHYLLDENYSTLLSTEEKGFSRMVSSFLEEVESKGYNYLQAFGKFSDVLAQNFGYRPREMLDSMSVPKKTKWNPQKKPQNTNKKDRRVPPQPMSKRQQKKRNKRNQKKNKFHKNVGSTKSEIEEFELGIATTPIDFGTEYENFDPEVKEQETSLTDSFIDSDMGYEEFDPEDKEQETSLTNSFIDSDMEYEEFNPLILDQDELRTEELSQRNYNITLAKSSDELSYNTTNGSSSRKYTNPFLLLLEDPESILDIISINEEQSDDTENTDLNSVNEEQSDDTEITDLISVNEEQLSDDNSVQVINDQSLSKVKTKKPLGTNSVNEKNSVNKTSLDNLETEHSSPPSPPQTALPHPSPSEPPSGPLPIT